MQTNCPNCSNKLVLDDAKVPATPFMLKCPKCGGTVKLPGRGAGDSAPAQQTRPVPSSPPPQTSEPAPVSAPAPTLASAPVSSGPAGRALLSFATPEQVNAVGMALARLGFTLETLDQPEECILRLQQGDYALVATSRNGISDDKNLYRVVQRLPAEIRRRLFLLLVGDEFKTGEGTQAFAMLADLVVQSKDAAGVDRLIAQTLGERRRLYQTFWDAEGRKAEGKL